ncbi:MAG: MFS transporter [Rhodospirillaceae bacterium]|nr:MFS transporter [Rhodospirillaceae bacterium]
MAGAILGPSLVARGEYWIAGAQFGGSFAAMAGCYVLAGAVLLALRPASSKAQEKTGGAVRPLRTIARSRLFIVAVVGAAMGQGVMAFMMTAAPLAMHVVDGHSLAATAAVIQAHVLAMYAPSLVAGGLITRYGAGRIMMAGAVLLGATLAAGLAGREIMHYGISMVALGFGWNFLYVGGTALLPRSYRPAERFRVQGLNDFTVLGCAAVGSLSAGAVMQLLGWDAVLYASMPAIMLAMAAILWARPDRERAVAG